MALDHEHFMNIALEHSRKAAAAGDGPVGSVIVRDGKIVAEGGNRVYTDLDPTAHGEVVVIREASRKLNTVELSGCTLYTAMEPCPMCCWAIIVAGISQLA